MGVGCERVLRGDTVSSNTRKGTQVASHVTYARGGGRSGGSRKEGGVAMSRPDWGSPRDPPVELATAVTVAPIGVHIPGVRHGAT